MIKAMMIAMLSLAGVAQAGTSFNYTPAAGGGFVTDTADTVQYVNVAPGPGTTQLGVAISIDGVAYYGLTPGSGLQFTAFAADGTYALVTATWVTKVTVSGSGRGGGYRITHRYAGSGSVIVP